MNESELIKKFSEIETSDFPDFNLCKKPLDKGLWVLGVAKAKLGIKKLTAEQIVSIIISAKEESIDTKSIINSFNKAGNKIHVYKNNKEPSFEIMMPGKKHVNYLSKEGYVELFYFEPDKKYTSRKILSKNILSNLIGDLMIVDPYCSEKTLYVIEDLKKTKIKFLTKIDNLKGNKRNRFLKDLKDFKTEYTNVEFRDYPKTDIHDRYIISNDSLVILGHSIKDLGGKESFAILFDKSKSDTIVKAVLYNFNNRWKQSILL